jgi:hypothetical protein
MKTAEFRKYHGEELKDSISIRHPKWKMIQRWNQLKYLERCNG